jgi:hypothetical protein
MNGAKEWQSANGRVARRMADVIAQELRTGKITEPELSVFIYDEIMSPFLWTIRAMAVMNQVQKDTIKELRARVKLLEEEASYGR